MIQPSKCPITLKRYQQITIFMLESFLSMAGIRRKYSTLRLRFVIMETQPRSLRSFMTQLAASYPRHPKKGDQRLKIVLPSRTTSADSTRRERPFTLWYTLRTVPRSAGGWWWPNYRQWPLKKKSKTANQSSDGLSFFNLGILIIIGIYHIILYFQRRRDSGALYFALFCLNLGVREFLVQKASSSLF